MDQDPSQSVEGLDRLDGQSEHDDLDELEEELLSDPAGKDAYEDAQRRSRLVSELADARDLSGLKQTDIAAGLGVAQSAVSDLESGRVDPRLSTVQRYARLCHRVLAVSLGGDEVAPDPIPKQSDAQRDDLDDLLDEIRDEPSAMDAYDDAAVRAALIASLVRSRRQHRLTQRTVASAIGTTQSVVSSLESGRTDPRLSTLHRYARACRTVLDVTLAQPNAEITNLILPTVDKAKADESDIAALRLAASASIEEVLRSLLKHRGGRELSDLVHPSARLLTPTKSRTVRGLTSRGWLSATDHDDATTRMLRLREDAATFIGVSIRADHVRGLLTGIVPRVIPKIYTFPLDEPSPELVARAVEALVRALRRDHSVEPMGLGVELSGPVNGTTGTVLFAPDLAPRTTSSWTSVPLEADIEQRVGLRTVVGNDAKSLATREMLLTDAPGGLLVVNVSESTEGIGAGLVFNGQIILGADGESGEIGHTIVDPDGLLCRRCGRDRRGCLETIASGAAVARRLGVPTLADASHALAERRPGAHDAFHEAGRALGTVMATAGNILNPQEVVLYGPPELTSDKDHDSARIFSDAVYRAMLERGFSKPHPLRLQVTNSWTGPLAAASLSVNDFLRRPLVYSPDMRTQPADGGRLVLAG